MAKNFIPMFWSKYCETGLREALVLANFCDYKYEGELKIGNKLKIVGAIKPLIQEYTGSDLEIEKLNDNSQFLEITKADAFAYLVDDVDEAQSKEGYLTTQFDEAKFALSESADKFVGTLAQGCDATMKSASTDISSATDPLALIDEGHIKLYNNGVSDKEELAADLTPEHIVLLRRKLASLFSENVEYIKKGAVGKYANTLLRMSNNLYSDGTDKYEMLRTKKAIAFAGQIDKIKVSDNTKGFGEIIKGLHVYGGKLTRPKELYVMRVH